MTDRWLSQADWEREVEWVKEVRQLVQRLIPNAEPDEVGKVAMKIVTYLNKVWSKHDR